jgi:hypothetical protein
VDLGIALDETQAATTVKGIVAGLAVVHVAGAGRMPFRPQVIELPADVRVGQHEESAHGRGAGRPQGREQPGHDAPEQLIRLHVDGRPCETRAAFV